MEIRQDLISFWCSRPLSAMCLDCTTEIVMKSD